VSSVATDLFGVSGRRMLKAIVEGKRDPGFDHKRRRMHTSEELTPRTPGISLLCGDFFLEFDKLISASVSLSLQFRFKSFLAFGVPLGQDGSVVFDLILTHRVKDDRDFVSRRGLRGGGTDFALYPAQVVSHRSEVVM
jgi:hypothetical protein